jgi:hypothetical protein
MKMFILNYILRNKDSDKMKLNNKGTTLVEIMISIVLIAIVMVFLFNLLLDLRADDGLSTKKNTDIINRAGIVRLIENDFTTKGIKELKFCDSDGVSCTDNNLHFNIYFKDGSNKVLNVYKDYITYGMERWDLTSSSYDLTNFNYCLINNVPYGTATSNYYSLKISIPVVKKSNSRAKLDIDLYSLGTNEGLSLPESLTYKGKTYNCG